MTTKKEKQPVSVVVQLTKRWGSRTIGSMISVSEERGRYLVEELKVGRDIYGALKGKK